MKAPPSCWMARRPFPSRPASASPSAATRSPHDSLPTSSARSGACSSTKWAGPRRRDTGSKRRKPKRRNADIKPLRPQTASLSAFRRVGVSAFAVPFAPMIDLKQLRENPDRFKRGARDKGIDVDIERLLKLDEQRRRLLVDMEN